MYALQMKSSYILKLLLTFAMLLSNLIPAFGVLAASNASANQQTQRSSQTNSIAEPHILKISPESGFLNTRTALVNVTFNVPMDQAETEAAFDIQPDAPHEFTWVNPSTLRIQFSEPLHPGSQYALTISGGTAGSSAQSLDGIALVQDYRWYYWLDTFQATINHPGRNAISIQFSTTIDTNKSGLPFEIQPPVNGKWKWTTDHAALFTAADSFAPAQEYKVVLTGSLYDEFGAIPYDGAGLTFAVLPPVRSVTPNPDQDVPLDFGPIQIAFSEPVDQASAQAALTITPPVSGHFSWNKSKDSNFEDTLSFLPDGLFEKNKQYSVSLAPTLKSQSGHALMLSAYEWKFTTAGYYDSYSAPASFGEYGSNVQVLDVNGPRKVQFTASPGLVQFEVYRYDLIDFVKLYAQNTDYGYGLNPVPLPAKDENRLLTSWYYTGGTPGSIDQTVIPPDVPAGLYVLNIKHENRSYSQLFLILTRNTIVTKRSGDDVFVWVSDINGKNIPDAEVRLYSDQGEKIREGKADENGLYRVSVPLGYKPLLVSAKVMDNKETDVTIAGLSADWISSGSWNWNQTDPTKYLIYTYTDRPIYKPGQTVNYKSILRDDQDVKYSLLPADTLVTVNIRDPKHNLLQSTKSPLNAFGTLNGSFAIAEGATLGDYSIETIVNGESAQQAFKVQDYRKPDFQVNLTRKDSSQANYVITGEALNLAADVRYFFGEPVANAQLTYTYYELFPSYNWWDFDSEDLHYRWMQTSDLGKHVPSKTDTEGQAEISMFTSYERADYGYPTFDDWRSSLSSKMYAVEVTADDGSNQPVSSTYIYKVTNADEKFSLDTHGYFKQPDKPFSVEASVKDLLDKPVAGHTMILEVKKWDKASSDFTLLDKNYTLTSDPNGVARQEVALKAGYYRLVLTGKDSRGNSVSYTHWVGVFSTGSDWIQRTNSDIEISAEKETYQPYETARFMIESQFSGPALLTFERGSIIHTKQVMLTAPLTVVDAQMIPEDAPNVFVTINAWQRTDRHDSIDDEYGYYSNIPDSHLRIARTELLVKADSKALDVSINTDKSVYKPAEQLTVNIDVKDYQGQPAQTEVSLAMVDEAIFSLSQELSPNIFKAFYGPRLLSVDTYDSMSPYREILAAGRGGGGGDAIASEPRQDFPDTAAWYPTLLTDENGRATITLTLPDNITSWRLSAKAISLNHQVGEAHTNIDVKKDLIVRPILPRMLTTGDQTALSVMVHNYSSQQRAVKITAQAEHLQFQDPITQSITIPAAGEVTVGWRIIPTGSKEIPLTFTAVADNQAQDSVRVPLPIQPLAVTDVQSYSGTFEQFIMLDLPRPQDILPDNSSVMLRISRSPASSLLDGLEFLTGYPYGCVEQTMSRAMPNAVLGRAAAQLGIGGEGFQARIDPLIAASIQKLYGYQHQDGGWGWWFDDASDDYQTAWVLHGLAVIQSSGYAIDPAVIDNGVKYLNQHLEDIDLRTRAYALYSMALVGKGDLDASLSLAENDLQQLDPFSEAALALAFQKVGDHEHASAILRLLEGTALRKGNFAYWPQSEADGEYHRKTMSSTVRTTAFVLSAILSIDGAANPLAKPTAEYLISRRNGYGWGTTNETSFTILALTDYLISQGADSGKGSSFTITLNGTQFSDGILEPGKLFYKIEIPLSSISAGKNKLELNTSGGAPLYYDLITRYALSRKSVEQAGNIEITRKYLDPNTGKPLHKIVAGQLVRVELTVEMPETGSFMLIEDHLPGGLEALNEGLNTTSHVSPYQDEYDSYIQYLWKDYGYNNKEIHGDRVSFFITTMKSGITTLTYLSRATTAGTFTSLPTEASGMYDPLRWGRSADSTLTVGQAP